MSSKRYRGYIDTAQGKTVFPFSVKLWNDTAAIVSATPNNEGVKKGYTIDSINGRSIASLLDTMYRYIASDGGNLIAKNQLLSTVTYFGSLYTALFGWQQEFDIAFKDFSGHAHNAVLKPQPVAKDSISSIPTKKSLKKKKTSKSERLAEARSLQIDSTCAVMQLNSFAEKLQLKQFIRNSFKKLKRNDVKDLVIDLRINTGGRISNSTYLLRYLTDKPYKTADSLYAITDKSNYSRYIKNDFLNKLLIRIYTKKKNGKFHYSYFEKHFFKPRKRYHYTDNIYLISGGLTYSASVLVLDALKGQKNVIIVGESSGGAAYGNSASMIPEVTLPHTKLRFRLPLFRMVIDKNLQHNGKGVPPDIVAGPTTGAIRKDEDYKMKKVEELIRNRTQ